MSRPHSTESVYRAIAHPTRRRVIEHLRLGERTAGELLDRHRGSQPALSEHLRVLRVTGLVSFRRRGTRLVYQLNPKPLRSLASWLQFVNPAN